MSQEERTRAPAASERVDVGLAGELLRLQATIGNRATARLLGRGGARAEPTRQPVIQPLLALGPQRDVYEREAHALADHVTGTRSLPPRSLRRVARSSAHAAGVKGVDLKTTQTIESARGGGCTLPRGLQRSLGRRIGADFSDVRVHTDARADGLNRQLNARAFTTGRDIFFRGGAYSPSSPRGRKVIAHELTHVVQQTGKSRGRQTGGGARAPIQRFLFQVGKDDEYTRVMFNTLQREHKSEGQLKISASWDKTWYGGTHGEYDPKKIKRHKKTFSRSTSKKLKGVSKGEPMRMVAHGSASGRFGGYTGKALGQMLVRIGLPEGHKGGIDLHGCLPASNWVDQKGNTRPSHAIELEDFLKEEGRTEIVRGYEHCVFPGSRSVEVPGAQYHLYEEVVLFAENAGINKKAMTLSPKQISYIEQGMGQDAAVFLGEKYVETDGKTLKSPYAWFKAVRDWMEKRGAFKTAELKDTSEARLELKSI
jgi:hypothetical protein